MAGSQRLEGVYGYLRSIEPHDAISYVGIGAVCLAVLIRTVRLTTGMFAAVIVTAGILYLLHESRRQETTSYNRRMEDKISALDALTGVRHPYLYTSPDLIDFFAARGDLRRFAPTSFDTALMRCDMLLKLQYDVKQGAAASTAAGRCKRNAEVANDLKNKALTSLWEFQFNVPSGQGARLEHAILGLQALLGAIVADMLRGCDELYDAAAFSVPASAQASDKLGAF
jgi:hypothetical protein